MLDSYIEEYKRNGIVYDARALGLLGFSKNQVKAYKLAILKVGLVQEGLASKEIEHEQKTVQIDIVPVLTEWVHKGTPLHKCVTGAVMSAWDGEDD